ncbi:putative Copper binding protein 5 [Capsicum annuum]|nr:putative Copper binding protein 5 [Capsicum annuum]
MLFIFSTKIVLVFGMMNISIAFLRDIQIVSIDVGNEVLGGCDKELEVVLLNTIENMYNATKKLWISDVVQISTAHLYAVFADSFPPSYCVFKDGVAQLMKLLLEFSKIESPFYLNANPFLTYTYNPNKIGINYALFELNKETVDDKTQLYYDNLLDAQIDAVYMQL